MDAYYYNFDQATDMWTYPETTNANTTAATSTTSNDSTNAPSSATTRTPSPRLRQPTQAISKRGRPRNQGQWTEREVSYMRRDWQKLFDNAAGKEMKGKSTALRCPDKFSEQSWVNWCVKMCRETGFAPMEWQERVFERLGVLGAQGAPQQDIAASTMLDSGVEMPTFGWDYGMDMTMPVQEEVAESVLPVQQTLPAYEEPTGMDEFFNLDHAVDELLGGLPVLDDAYIAALQLESVQEIPAQDTVTVDPALLVGEDMSAFCVENIDTFDQDSDLPSGDLWKDVDQGINNFFSNDFDLGYGTGFGQDYYFSLSADAAPLL